MDVRQLETICHLLNTCNNNFTLSDFDRTLKRPVSSRYGTGLFSTLFHPGEGKTFNVMPTS